MGATRFQGGLPRDRIAPWIARQTVEDWFGELVEPTQLHNLRLLTSELVTNAVVHGTGEITLRGELNDDRVLIEVVDEGHGFEPPPLPPASAGAPGHGPTGAPGHGLRLVDHAASRWGIHEGTTHVWFELPRVGLPPDP